MCSSDVGAWDAGLQGAGGIYWQECTGNWALTLIQVEKENLGISSCVCGKGKGEPQVSTLACCAGASGLENFE